MFRFKRKTSPDTEASHELTAEERQRRKKFLIYPLMFLLFAGSMWLIFAPSKKEAEKESHGFNTDMPAPQESGLIGDKKKAYEKELMEQKEQERTRAMQDMGMMFKEMTGASSPTEENNAFTSAENEAHTASSPKWQASTEAYRDINRTLGNFYEMPQEDPEKEELRAKLAELEERMTEQQPSGTSMDDQMALLEKSYQLAAKYMPSSGSRHPEKEVLSTNEETASERKAVGHSRSGKSLAVPVRQVSEQVVSALAQPMSDSTLLSEYGKERNYAFHTAIGGLALTEKNTIAAVVHSSQHITDGQTVRFRLLEPMQVAHREIPRNTLLVGTAKIQGERLSVFISSIEYQESIIHVELSVYDTDGQEGIFIPGSMERNAAKEIAAGMGTAVGSSVTFASDAGTQIAADAGKGLLQGVSQYFAKKIRTVKVHLKAGYKVMLHQAEE